MTTPFVLAIPSKGRLQEKTDAFFASARSAAAALRGSPERVRKRSIVVTASFGSAPPASVDCSRKRSAISATERPPTLVAPAIDIRSVTSPSAALRSEPASAAITP